LQRFRFTNRLLTAFTVLVLPILVAPAAAASWVVDEVRVNVRSGASNKYRVIGAIGTGDQAEILSRQEGWTQIRTGTIESGWIPAGYLQPDPPSQIVLEKREQQIAELERRVEQLTQAESRIRIAHDEIVARDTGQQAKISRLTRETLEMRVGARWPEWLTGAGIVLVGMILGSIVSRSSNRRRQPRIKL
jgi:hypothetical protein